MGKRWASFTCCCRPHKDKKFVFTREADARIVGSSPTPAFPV